jgi:hypothetical protein
LSDLTDDKEFVDAARAQRSEGVLPWRGQWLDRISEQRGHNPPGFAQINSAAHNFSSAPNLFKTKEKDGNPGGFSNNYDILTQLNSAKFRQHNGAPNEIFTPIACS